MASSLWVNLPVAPLQGYTDRSFPAKVRDAIRRIEEAQAETSSLAQTTRTTVSSSTVPTTRTISTTGPLAGGGSLAGDLTLSLPRATATVDGYLAAEDWAAFNAKLSAVPIASTTVLGGIKVGSRLTIAPDGTLSAADQSYALPIATGTVLGGVKIGSGISIAPDGTISVLGYALPIASAGTLGGIRIGSGLVIDPGTGILSVSQASGIAGEADATYYVHEQLAAATQWQIRHDLGKVPTGILVVVDGEVIEPAIEIGPAAATAYYTHEQTTPATTWTIDHGLGDFPTGLLVRDGSGEVIESAIEIDQVTPYQVRLRFLAATAGKAYLSTGGEGYPVTLTFTEAVAGKAYLSIGSFRAPYRHTQATPAAAWTIDHGLGRVPTAIRAFGADGALLEPRIEVLEVDPYTLTLRFDPDDPPSGTAWIT